MDGCPPINRAIQAYFNVVFFAMHTIVELPTFTKGANEFWNEQALAELCTWLVNNPNAGDVIPGATGCRKVR